MKRLSAAQMDRTSEILGNISVTWFSAGVISPVFVKPKDVIEFISLFLLSLIMSGLFFVWSLSIAKEIK